VKILSIVTKLSVLLAILLLLSLLGYAIFGNRVFLKSSPIVGQQASDFTLELFNGEKIKLSDIKGKAVLLNFWASWCIPCKDEAPALEAAWKKYKDKPVVFIGLNVWDDKDSALLYLKEFGGEYENGMDPKGEIAVEYGVGGVPETFFIDTSGKIVDKYIGPLTEVIIDYFLGKALSQDHGITKDGN